MKLTSPALKFFLNLSQVHSSISRRFDGRLNGLSLTEFLILYHLSEAEGEKLRRVDLAEKIGLTASGVTRILLPMEKIGLVKKEATDHDARVSFVLLASGGKRKLSESIERAELFAEELLPSSKTKNLNLLLETLTSLGGSIK